MRNPEVVFPLCTFINNAMFKQIESGFNAQHFLVAAFALSNALLLLK